MATFSSRPPDAKQAPSPSTWVRIRFGLGVALAFGLVALNGVMDIVNTQRLSYPGMFGYALVGPAVIAALFCLPKSGRTKGRFLAAFNIISLLVFFNVVVKLAHQAEAGKDKGRSQVQQASEAKASAP